MMTELQSDDSLPSEPHSFSTLDPTHPAWFGHQAALALLTRFTTVHGYSQLLTRAVERPPLDPDRLDRYAHALGHAVSELGRLVRQYLEAVQLQAGLVTLMRRPVGLRELLASVAAASAGLPEWTERHTLVIEQPDAVIGQWDPHWVIPALAAVVSNAMKFTPDGGWLYRSCGGQPTMMWWTGATSGGPLSSNPTS